MGRIGLMAAVLLCGWAVCDDAVAQRGRSSSAPRTGSSSEEELPPSVPPPLSTLPPSRGIAGPRLLPGAVLCRSEDDLQHRAEVNRRRVDGALDAGNPLENCRLLPRESGVEIVARHGLGRTQVKIKPAGDTGWTDSYLP